MTCHILVLPFFLRTCPPEVDTRALMAPSSMNTSISFNRSQSQSAGFAPAAEILAQWSKPTDVLTVLMIVGGDIVKSALAQLAGDSFTPVAFSFGASTLHVHTDASQRASAR